MRAVRPALQLGVGLGGHEPRVVTKLDELHQPVVGADPAPAHPGLAEALAVGVVDLEPMPVALVHDLGAVRGADQAVVLQAGRVEAQAHGAALLGDIGLVGHEVDDRVLGEDVELAAVRVIGPERHPAELDDRALQAEAQAEVRDAVPRAQRIARIMPSTPR